MGRGAQRRRAAAAGHRPAAAGARRGPDLLVLGGQGARAGAQYSDIYVAAAHAVRELVVCQVELCKKFNSPRKNPVWFLPGFNLDTGEWEQVHHEQALLRNLYRKHVGGKAFELDPNLVLPS